MTAHNNKLPYIFLLLTALLWGLAVPITKATINTVPPLSFLGLRFLIATIIALPFAISIFKKNKFNKKRIKNILIVSILEPVLAISLLFIGISMTTSTNTSVITAFGPLMVSIFSYIFLHEFITKKQIEGTLIAFIGILTIILAPIFIKGSLEGANEFVLIGNLFVFAGVLADVGYVIYSKKHISPDKIISPQIIIILSFLIGAIFFIPMGLIEQYTLFKKSNITTEQICTRLDLDKGDYDDNYTCDTTGCFKIKYKVGQNTYKVGETVGTIENLQIDESKKDYYCKLNIVKKTFKDTLFTNIQSYIQYPSILGILYMSLISGFLAYILYQKGLEKIEASESSLFTYLQPLFGIPIAIILLKETTSIYFLVGAILIAIGVIYAEKHGKK